jgi:hypothetical protein
MECLLPNASKSFSVSGLKKTTLTRIFYEKQRKTAGIFLNFTGQFEHHSNPDANNLYKVINVLLFCDTTLVPKCFDIYVKTTQDLPPGRVPPDGV